MYFEPIYVLIALLPIIGHLLPLGLIRVSGRVLITTGSRDIGVLGFAIAGLVAVGPGELFFPKPAASVFGPWVWLALIVLYGLVVTLVALTAKPRLVVYGRTPDQMFDPLLRAARELDADATPDRERLEVSLPSLKVHLRVAGHRGLDSASIESFQPIISVNFWNKLLGHLRETTQSTSATSPRQGIAMLLMALALSCIVAWQGFSHRDQVVEGFREWLFR